ncbi:hypothetical protein [Paenibacillus paeoniae]|nr:hypothetical protein [Paenibacillus paeoniae]
MKLHEALSHSLFGVILTGEDGETIGMGGRSFLWHQLEPGTLNERQANED